MEEEKLIRGPKIMPVFEKAKASRFPSLAVLHKTTEVANFDDTVCKYEHLIRRTIDQLEKLDFYQQRLDTIEMCFERRQSECLKRLEIVLRMPIGCYWGKCFSLIIGDTC
jgi:hypothetical protein